MKEIYLDNAATTKTHTQVDETMAHVMRNVYGNPSSLHRSGMRAEKHIKEARNAVAKAIGCNADEIYFTSGGTESDNLAIIGFVQANRKRGNHIITTKFEHPAVLETFKYLGDCGLDVDYLDIDISGQINLKDLEDKLRADTLLVSVMQVNNEIGSIMPISEIKAITRRKSSVAVLHTDAVQSFGKIELLPARWGVDMLSISAHKIHGPKGVGAIYVKKGTIIKPIMFGGGQQNALRPGTENVAGIVGFGEAVKVAMANLDENRQRVLELKTQLLGGITQNIPQVVVNSPVSGSPYILNVSFLGVRSEILLHSLESQGIYVSSGSACSSKKAQLSNTLSAMRKSKDEADSALRFSLSAYNTAQEIDICINALKTHTENIRKYM